MNLWIRNQYKGSLRKIDNIFYSSIGNLHCIKTNIDAATITLTLGQYDSKERCMEILDDIQSMLTRPMISNSSKSIVYEMPEE